MNFPRRPAIEAVPCDVEVDKQVSCDGGITYVDVGFNDGVIEACTALDGTPIKVRYAYRNTGQQQLFCEIEESNDLIGPTIGPFTIPVGTTVLLVDQPDAICSETLDGREPDTATINCDCVIEDPPFGDVTDSDTADFDCIECNVSLDKSITVNGTAVGVGVKGGTATTVDNQRVEYKIEVTQNSRDIIEDCLIVDPKLGINQPEPVITGPVTIDIPAQCTDGPDGTEGRNTATVTCNICRSSETDDALPDMNSDSDFIDLVCLSPSIGASKQCVTVGSPADGIFDYVITVDNTGETSVSCVVEDQVVTGACPQTPTNEPILTGSTGVIAMNSSGSVTFEDEVLTETSCNNAKVTCTILDVAGNPEQDDCIIDPAGLGTCAWSGEPCGSDADCGVKTIVQAVQDECPVEPVEGCRMTGGHNVMVTKKEEGDPQYDDIPTGTKYTTGGQIGAPNNGAGAEGCTDVPWKGRCIDGVCDGGHNDGLDCVDNGECPNANGRNAGRPWGQWQHNHHSGPDDGPAPNIADGSFSFHSGTASSPRESMITSILCADPGWCVQARPAPTKQIFWEGIGVFHNLRKGKHAEADIPHFVNCGEQPTVYKKKDGGTLHYYRAHVGDFGEPAGRHQKPLDDCPWVNDTGVSILDCALADGFTPLLPAPVNDKFTEAHPLCTAQDCTDCPDYYEIEISCDMKMPGDDGYQMAYKVAHHIRQGNFQIHPPVGDSCNPEDGVLDGLVQ
jgi:hypothetical protein